MNRKNIIAKICSTIHSMEMDKKKLLWGLLHTLPIGDFPLNSNK